MPAIDAHFDRAALVAAVYQQPIGLEVSTNHPEGFRRLMYLHCRENPSRKISIMQSPNSAHAFWLVREDFDLEHKDA